VRRLAASIGLVLASGVPAAGFDLLASAGVAYQSVQLWHDASSASPLLGNPTSILDYRGLVAPYVELSGSVPLEGWTLSGEVRIQGAGGGAFQDTDYLSGGVLLSDTWSVGAVHLGLEADLRLYPDVEVQLGTGSLRPLMAVAAEGHSLAAFGLACGSVCLGPPVAESVEVIGHQLYGTSAGVGGEVSFPVSTAGRLDLLALGTVGVVFANDSHRLRTDLGPMPNITSQFTVLGVDTEARYLHSLSDALSGVMVLGASFERGWGTTSFGASTVAPLTFPAGFQRVQLRLGVGLEGRF